MHMMSTNKLSAKVPPTISDQIRLWEQERDRFQVSLRDLQTLVHKLTPDCL